MQESIELQKAERNLKKSTDKFDNKALMSFVPCMESLPLSSALDIRMKITEVFRDATTMQPLVESTSTPGFNMQPHQYLSTRPDEDLWVNETLTVKLLIYAFVKLGKMPGKK